MTFPCPSCEKMISLTGTQAIGPCPYCSVELQAIFTVNILDEKPQLRGPDEKGYDARCFRPDGRPSQSSRHVHTPRAR